MKNSEVLIIVVIAAAAGWIARGEYEKRKRIIKPTNTEGAAIGKPQRRIIL